MILTFTCECVREYKYLVRVPVICNMYTCMYASAYKSVCAHSHVFIGCVRLCANRILSLFIRKMIKCYLCKSVQDFTSLSLSIHNGTDVLGLLFTNADIPNVS